MANLEIIGFPQSTYVRVARMACEEKGVAYDLRPAPPHSPEVLAIHPFGKIPAMRHGDIRAAHLDSNRMPRIVRRADRVKAN